MSSDVVPLTPTPSDHDGPYLTDYYDPAGYILPRTYQNHYEQVLELPINDDDVWIVSHPRCGSTWTSEMVWILRHHHDYNGAQQPLSERVPFLEHSSMILNRLTEDKREVYKTLLPLVFADSFRNAAEMPRPRTIRTHLPWNVLPRNLTRPDCKAKVIYVSRDPKDVCWSYYYDSRLLHKEGCSFEEFAEDFLADRTTYAPFWKHFLEFWDRKERKNILFLRYEDMKQDLSFGVQVVNEFLELLPLSGEQLEKITHHLRFESMKSNKAVNTPFGAGFDADDTETTQVLRKGIVGDWKGKMSLDMARRFNEWTVRQTRGYELPF